MIVLSVDYGDVRTGIAVCDKSEFLASPVKVVTEKDPNKLALTITELCKELKTEQIVMGLPKNMDGTEGFRAQSCRSFAALLEEKSAVPVILRDERLTTVCAHTLLNETNTRGKKRKETVDAVAAVLILEDYLQFRKNSSK